MRTITSFGIERVFQTRYTSSLARVRRAFITNTTVLGLSGGMALSSYLVMMAVAIVYGCYRLAGELEASRFPFKTNYTDPTYGITVEAYYCADADGQLVNVSFGDACEKISQLPYYMSCQFGATLENVGSTKMGALAEGQAQAAANPSGGLKTPCDPPAVEASSSSFEVPKYMENMTMLELFNLSAVGALGEYVQQQAPPEYLNTNPGYYDCTISGTNILLAVFAVMMMGEGFSMAGSPANQLAIGRQAAAKILAIINRPPPIDSFSEDGAKPSKVYGDIQVKDVVFAYPSSPNTLVCKGYNLSIAAGQTVALCGPSGSGKSTIIQLIERFYDPQQGVVTLDGVDIKTLNVRWLRSQMGLVAQEPVLFQGTVAQNIAYGASEGVVCGTKEIEEAAKMANAHEFIMNSLGDGYQTDVGLKGGKLSGGQKQRVAIARAIVRKPAVLLLDEATSALDNESERIVQAALDEIMTKMRRTTIVIAHRLSTIRNADKIAVVSEGSIVEEGTHDELLANHGLYTNLVMST